MYKIYESAKALTKLYAIVTYFSLVSFCIYVENKKYYNYLADLITILIVSTAFYYGYKGVIKIYL